MSTNAGNLAYIAAALSSPSAGLSTAIKDSEISEIEMNTEFVEKEFHKKEKRRSNNKQKRKWPVQRGTKHLPLK